MFHLEFEKMHLWHTIAFDFEVLQDSVETLFRWAGKHNLHYFMRDLFMTLCVKFYQNQFGFIGVIQTFGVFLWFILSCPG